MKYRTEYIYRKFILILLVEIMIGMACTFIGLFIRIIPYKEGVIYDIESISSIIGFLFLINGLLFFFIVFFASKLYCNKKI